MEINYAYQMTYTDPYLSLKLNQKTNKKLNQTTPYGRRRRVFFGFISSFCLPHTWSFFFRPCVWEVIFKIRIEKKKKDYRTGRSAHLQLDKVFVNIKWKI